MLLCKSRYSFAVALVSTALVCWPAFAETYTATNVVVAPLTEAHWTQGAPYNDYSPRSWSTGCEAISSSQELLVWQWPWRLGAIHSTSHSVNGDSDSVLRFDGSVPFDWSSMLNSYGSGATLKQKHEAARLSLMCQSLLQMQYVNGGAEAMKQIPGTMEWFEYVGKVVPNANGGDDAAVAAVREDFEFGSPAQVGVPSHAVVGLGYATGTNSVGASVDLIWLNYGWGGGSDGWYDLRGTNHYASSGLLYNASPIRNVHVGFRPIKSVQIEPLAPVSGSGVTLDWHLPNCYTNRIDGFVVEKKKLGAGLTSFADDFSASDGRSSNTNVMRVRNGQLYAWSGQGTTGIYTWDDVFVPTAESEISYDATSCYMSSMEARLEVKADGVWDAVAEIPLSGTKDDLIANGSKVSLASFAGKPIQLRIAVEYTKGGVFQHDVANVHIDNVSVSNVRTFETVATDSTIAASARSATFNGLASGETYAFSVTPIMSDGSAAVTQTAATTVGTPAAAPTISAVTMSPRGSDLVQEGFYADIAMGLNIIDVACSESVTSLEAFISHQSVLPQSKKEVVDNGSGSFSVNIDATEVAAKWANQKMILTLKATNATGESAYKDVELCLKASGVPVSFPDANIWSASGSDWYGDTSLWSKGRAPNSSDRYVVFSRTGNTEVYITDDISLDTVVVEGGGSFKFVDFFYGEASVSIQTLLSETSFTMDATVGGIGEIKPLNASSACDIHVSSGKSATIAGGKTWTIGGGVYLAGNQTFTVNGALTDSGALVAEGAGTTLALAPTATVSAASLSFANNAIRFAITQDASPALSVSGAATLTDATIEVSLADGMTAGDSIALMSAGSFTGVGSATLNGLDGYNLEVSGGTLYAKKKGETPAVVGPVPVAVWDGDFSPSELTKFSGYELIDWNQTHGGVSHGTNPAEDYSSVTIDRANQGLMFHSANGLRELTVLVQYSSLQNGSNKRVLFTSTIQGDYTGTRTGIRIGTDGVLRGLWGTADWNDSRNPESGTVPESGVMAFAYSKGGTLLYTGGTVAALAEVWKCASLKADADTDNSAIRGASVGGYGLGASASGYEAAKGMTITRLAVFTNVLTVAEMNAYKWPSEQVEPTSDDERDPIDGNEMTRLNGKVFCGNDANRAVITNYLSQMEGTRPLTNPAPCTVDLLLVYDTNAVNYVKGLNMSLEEHAARSVAVMNQALIPTDIDTNVWFRVAGIYPIEVAADHVDDALNKLNAGTAPGWEMVRTVRDRVGADVVLAVVYSKSNYGLANWCSPASIRNGNAAGSAYAGVRADAAWAWVHETGHLASLYHNPGEAAGTYHDPTSIGCGFVKTAADGTELRSLMDSGTAQLAFSSPNHLCHGEVYSVTNATGQWVDSSGVLAELLPYMARYRETKVPESPALKVFPQNNSVVADGAKMTVSFDDPEAAIWYSADGGVTETQYTGPVAIDAGSFYGMYGIYIVTAKKNGETVATTTATYHKEGVNYNHAEVLDSVGISWMMDGTWAKDETVFCKGSSSYRCDGSSAGSRSLVASVSLTNEMRLAFRHMDAFTTATFAVWVDGLPAFYERTASDSAGKWVRGELVLGAGDHTVEFAFTQSSAVAGSLVRLDAVSLEEIVKTTATTGFPVPYSWIEACFPGIEGYPDAMYETMAKSAGDNGYTYWESYVLGLEPTNELSKFTAVIRMEGDRPVVEYFPTNETLKASGEIEYILQGKPALENGWQDVGFAAPGDTNRFFRVKVSW